MILQTLNLWLHLISFALWIGAIVFFLLVFSPAVHSLPPGQGVRLLDKGRKSFQTLSWVAIGLLIVTGVLNLLFRGMAAGFEFGQGYSWILAVKLFLFLSMLLHHSLQALKYSPTIASLTMQTGADIESWPDPLLSQWKRWFLLLKINAAIGPVVLLLGLALAGR